MFHVLLMNTVPDISLMIGDICYVLEHYCPYLELENINSALLLVPDTRPASRTSSTTSMTRCLLPTNLCTACQPSATLSRFFNQELTQVSIRTSSLIEMSSTESP